jgi:WD40 repeat protein
MKRLWLPTLTALLLTTTPGTRIAPAQENASPPVADTSLPVADLNRDTPVDFQSEILPLLKDNCLACHNQTKAKADLILETPQTILKGGDSGPAVVPRNSSESLLFQVSRHKGETVMPPKGNKVKASNLTPQQLALLRLWIDQGAQGEVRAAAPMLWQPLPETFQPIFSSALSPDAQFAASGRGNQIFLYHLSSGHLLTRLSDLSNKTGAAHRDVVNSLAFSPDSSLLASGGYRQIKLWRRAARAPHLVVPIESVNEGSQSALDPSGRWIAAAMPGQGIRIWQVSDGHELVLRNAECEEVTALRFSRTGSQLAAGCSDHSLRVWNLSDGSLQSRIETDTRAIAWLDERGSMATAHPGGILRLWKLSESGSLEPIRQLEIPDTEISALDSGPGPKDLFSGSTDGFVRRWNTETGEVIGQFEHGTPVTAIAVRADAQRVVSSGTSPGARLWKTSDGALVGELKGDRYASELAARTKVQLTLAEDALDFRKSSLKKLEDTLKEEQENARKAAETLATTTKTFDETKEALAAAKKTQEEAEKSLADLERALQVATTEYQQAETTMKAAEEAVRTALNQPVEGSADTQAARKSLETAIETLRQNAFAAGLLKPRFDQVTAEAPEQKKLLAKKIEETTKATAAAQSALTKAELAKTGAENDVALTNRSVEKETHEIASAQADLRNAETLLEQAKTDLESAREKARLAETPVHTLVFSDDLVTVATADGGPSVRTWSAETGVPFETFDLPGGALRSLCLSADQRLIAGTSQAATAAWNLNPSWTLERTLGTGDNASSITDRVNALAFTPDGQHLVSGGGEPSRSGEILVWQVSDGSLLHEFNRVHSDSVLALQVSPDGKHLASGASDRFARMIDLSSGTIIKSFEGHTHHVLGVSWKATGRTLMTAGADNVIKVWDTVTGARTKNIDGFDKEITAVRFLGISDRAAATSGDAQAVVLKENGEKVLKLKGCTDFMYTLDVSSDGTRIVAGGQDGVLRVWDGDGNILTTFPSAAPTGKIATAIP